jgi:hypothetical protein
MNDATRTTEEKFLCFSVYFGLIEVFGPALVFSINLLMESRHYGFFNMVITYLPFSCMYGEHQGVLNDYSAMSVKTNLITSHPTYITDAKLCLGKNNAAGFTLISRKVYKLLKTKAGFHQSAHLRPNLFHHFQFER